MILVTLMMAVELLQRKQASPAQRSAKIVEQVKPVVDDADREIADLEQKLAENEEVLKELAGVDPEALRQQLAQLENAIRRIREEVAAASAESAKADDRAARAHAEKERRSDDPKTLDDLISQAQEIQKQLEEIRKSNRIIYNVTPNFSKTPWLVEIGENALLAAPARNPSSPVDFPGADDQRIAAFLSWASARDNQSDFFMLLIKPSGSTTFRKIREGLQSAGFDIGFDLIEEDQTAMDRTRGAASP